MLRRLAIVIYWIGFVIGGFFLLLDIAVVLVLLGDFGQSETGSDWLGFVIFTIIGLFSWGIGWIIRYIVTGAKGISPMAKGRDDAFADAFEGGEDDT